ncbi:MAG: Hemin transport system permease protein HmuU [Anaerolineales bacterium]|nr:Hemin transport system permease protein HmuU [Anaerolineales bacterium]
MALLALSGLVAVSLVLSLGLGAVSLTPSQVVDVLASHLPWGEPVEGVHATIVWDLRLARALLAALIGAGLAAAGAAFQGLFRNPLADPFIVGASGGAALGATLAITAGLRWSGAGFGPVPLAAFVGTLLAVALVYAVAETGGHAPAVALLLAGAALSTILSAAVSLLMLLNDRALHEVFTWLLGGLGGRSWPHLRASVPYLLIGLASLWLMARPLDALASGEETAQSLGLRLPHARGAIVAAASLTTAAAVAVGGIIGFVGLIAPHAARLLFGADHHRLIPASALLGALLLLLADDLARTVLAPVELPVGIVTALLGGPFFLYLLKTRQRELGG